MASVLIIDDEPRAGLADLLGAYWAHPNDVTEEQVRQADLIIIDQFLRNWSFDAGSPATMHPRGGLAVAAVLRSQLEKQPTPIVIFTGALDELAEHLPLGIRQAELASEFGVEWVGDRTDTALPGQLEALHIAASALPRGWEHLGFASPEILEWLGLEDSTEWTELAVEDFEECRPQISGMSRRTGGTAFLRWFIHRILPFPTCLLDDLQAATRIGLTLDGFYEVLDSEPVSPLAHRIASVTYTGQLSNFLGRRWWRAGIDWVLEAADGWPQGEITNDQALADLHGSAVESLGDGHWLVPLDGELRQESPRRYEELVRILPSFWPAYADDAYALAEDADEDPRLDAWRA